MSDVVTFEDLATACSRWIDEFSDLEDLNAGNRDRACRDWFGREGIRWDDLDAFIDHLTGVARAQKAPGSKRALHELARAAFALGWILHRDKETTT